MDQHLQQLRRAWQASSSTADEAAYLLERVRVGDLTRERLELASYCGHVGAAKASGVDPWAGSLNAKNLAEAVAKWGPHWSVQLALLNVQRALCSLSAPLDSRLLNALELVRAWLASPSPESARTARNVGYEVEEFEEEVDPSADLGRVGSALAFTTHAVGRTIRLDFDMFMVTSDVHFALLGFPETQLRTSLDDLGRLALGGATSLDREHSSSQRASGRG